MSSACFMPIPRFHREFFPDWAKGIEPCVPRQKNEQTAAPALTGLPLSLREAEAVLREWRAMDAGILRQEAVRAAALAAAGDGLRPGEGRALNIFRTGTDACDELPLAQRAQRLLLMAWVQEERVLDMRALNSKFAEQEQRLARLLAEDDDEPRMSGKSFDDGAALLPPWNFVLEALGRFLPENAVLVAVDPVMTAELAFLGAEEKVSAAELPPLAVPVHLSGVRISLNKLLGKRLPFAGGEVPRLFLFHS